MTCESDFSRFVAVYRDKNSSEFWCFLLTAIKYLSVQVHLQADLAISCGIIDTCQIRCALPQDLFIPTIYAIHNNWCTDVD